MNPCPQCSGKGRNTGFISTSTGHFFGSIKCRFCEGTGTIAQALFERIQSAKVMQAERRQRRLTPREEAARLNVDFSEWLRIESGLMPISEAGQQGWLLRLKECGL
jgi:hypothetical protein